MTSEILVVREYETSVLEFAREPGAWARLPKADTDWDSPETNTAIADGLGGGELT